MQKLTGGQGRVGLAVSGGPDSLALLILARRWGADRIAAATVDHGLRPEAAQEAEYVARICDRLSVPHIILHPEKAITGNIQSAARSVRYDLLRRWATGQDCDWIATAHHADDQLETFLMRLARGSGVDGLAGIRARNGNIIRPLLGFAKEQLEQVCKDAGIDPVRDPSNEDTDFDRVRIRQWLARQELPFSVDAACRSAAALADSADALEWMSAMLFEERLSRTDGEVRLDTSGLPTEIKRRLLRRAATLMEPERPHRGSALAKAVEMLDSGEQAMLGDVIIKPGKGWTLKKAPKRKSV